jgi:hypothetical protein
VSATFWQARITAARYCAPAWSRAASAARCLWMSAPASNRVCVSEAPASQNPVYGGKQLAELSALEPTSASMAKLRQHIGDRHADRGGCCVQILLRLAHVGTLLDDLRRQADRQIRRQGQIFQAKGFLRLIGGQPSQQGGQRVAGLPQLLLQRRQRLRRLRLRRLLGKQVELAGGPEPALALHDVGQLLCHLQQPLGGGDLPAQAKPLGLRSPLHCCSRSGRWPRAGSDCFAPAPWQSRPGADQAEDIRGIGQGQLGRVQRCRWSCSPPWGWSRCR